jgi:hypothetical protein
MQKISVPHSSQFHRDEWEGKNLNAARNKTSSPQAARRSLIKDNRQLITLCPIHRSFIAMSGKRQR